MDLVKAGTLGAPNVCFICETFPQEGSSLVDTQRDHEYGNFRPLSGRKYVCESCVNELARAFGLSDGVRERVALETVDRYDRAYYELKWELKSFAERLEALVNRPLTSFTDTEKVEPEITDSADWPDPYENVEEEVEEITDEETIVAVQEFLDHEVTA
jgi:hypothetical protein